MPTTTLKSHESAWRATLFLLAHTPNEAATEALIRALDSPRPDAQLGALTALLERDSPRGHAAILARLHTAPPAWRDVLAAPGEPLSGAIDTALRGDEPQLIANACRAMVWLRTFSPLPALVRLIEAEDGPHARLAADTLWALADQISGDASTGQGTLTQARILRQRMAECLEPPVRRYAEHRRDQVVRAFLAVAAENNATLRHILQNPQHPAHERVVHDLQHGERPAMIRLLLSFLDDPQAPSAAIALVGRRQDPPFMHALLEWAWALSPAAQQNLKRVESLAWLRIEPAALDQLDEQAQSALVQLIVATSIRRADVFRVVDYLLANGTPMARAAAATALRHFPGPEGVALLTAALEDGDAGVQSAALSQIRERNLPGALSRLLAEVDSPRDNVRQAVRNSLPELTFDRYVAAFDSLDEAVRGTAGKLVLKMHPESLHALADELVAQSSARRLRALAIVRAMGAGKALAAWIAPLTDDPDPAVRAAVEHTLPRPEASVPKRRAADCKTAEREADR